MKKRDLTEIHKKARKDLEHLLGEKHLQLEKIVMDIKISRENNLKKAKNLRKEISQIATILREKDYSGEERRNK